MIKAKLHKKISYEGSSQVEKRILAICDSDLLGKVFEEGDLVLDLQKYRSFYEGDTVTEQEIQKLLTEERNINLVGKKTLKIATKALNIDPKNVKNIGGVPHIQFYYV